MSGSQHDPPVPCPARSRTPVPHARCVLTVPRSACNNAALATHACCVLSVPRPVSHCTAFIPFLCPSVPSVHGGDVGDCLQGLPYDFAALCPTLAKGLPYDFAAFFLVFYMTLVLVAWYMSSWPKKSKGFFPRDHTMVARGLRDSPLDRPNPARARRGCWSIGSRVAL